MEKFSINNSCSYTILFNFQAFMFETSLVLALSKWAATSDKINSDYYKVWEKLPKTFRSTLTL